MQNRQRQVPPQQKQQFPYNCIVGIQILYASKENKRRLTGFLIEPDLVLTTAHCFLSKEEESGQIKSITVCYEGREVKVSTSNVRINDDYLKWRKLQTNEQKKEQIKVQKKVQKKIHALQLAKMDFALIRLPSKIIRKQYFVLEKITSHDSEGIALCGYVLQNNFKLCVQNNFKLCERLGRIKIKKDIGFYKIDTNPGQDGSPIFLTKQNNIVVGIHKGFAKIQEANFCCPVTDYLVQGVIKLKKQLKTSVNHLDQYKNQSRVQYIRANSYFQLQSQPQPQPYNEQFFEELKGMQPKASFHGLKILQLKEQVMKENYVEQLCKCQFPALKEIKLDNDISLAGVVQLVFNEWNKQVTYILNSVRTSDGGYLINVGQNIPIIKRLVKDRNSINNDAIDSMNDSKELYEALYLMMEMPFEGKEQEVEKQSAFLQEEMKKKIANKENQVSIQSLLLTIKQQLRGSRVTFSHKSNIKSQITLRLFSTQMKNKRVMIDHKIEEPRWNFKQFQNNRSHLMAYQQWYLGMLSQKYEVDLRDLTIHKLTKGCINNQISVDIKNPLLQNKDFYKNESIVLSPFFQQFNLSSDDFEPSFDFTYPQVDKVSQLSRGKIPFFQPIRCKKFTIKVQSIYDNGNNKWILSNGDPGQWAIAFHGINYPGQIIKNPASKDQTVLEAIMSGRERGEMLKAGFRQAYDSVNAINKPGEQVGSGIYLSPYFTVSLFDYTQPVQKAGETYHVVLMCRFRPEVLKCTSNPQYWVINQSKNVRPCGILLVTPTQKSELWKLSKSIYGEKQGMNYNEKPCHWQKWGAKMQP